MSDIFLKVLNTSISAGWIVLIVATLRLILKRAPKWVMCLMWFAVGMRLVLPISFESPISLLPSKETVNNSLFYGRFVIQSGVRELDGLLNTYLGENYCEGITAPIGHFDNIMDICGMIWLSVAAVFMLYGIISYTYLSIKVSISLPYKDNIFFCETIDSPFTFGIFSTKIYLPIQMDEKDRACVILHEQAHVSRHDTLWKLLAGVLVAVYWFNPIIWLSYTLFIRDIEYACDEKVIGRMDLKEKKLYSSALIACKKRQGSFLGSTAAFGEISVKKRILTVLMYKRPNIKMRIVSLLLCILLFACFLTDPVSDMRRYNIPSVMLSLEHIHESTVSRLAPVHTEVTDFGEFEVKHTAEVSSCGLCSVPHEHEIGTWTRWFECKGCGKEYGRRKEENVELCPQKAAMYVK